MTAFIYLYRLSIDKGSAHEKANCGLAIILEIERKKYVHFAISLVFIDRSPSVRLHDCDYYLD
jgi:hypothetical protein